MPGSKVCFKCGTLKPLSEYYRHSQMGDGHLNKCKECAKKDVMMHREANLDKIRKYDRERGKIPERAKRAAKVSAEWRKADARRGAAHSVVSRAIRSGELVPKDCERCGCTKVYAHHESYAKENQLKVVWLCQPCHKKRHKEMVLEGIEP